MWGLGGAGGRDAWILSGREIWQVREVGAIASES